MLRLYSYFLKKSSQFGNFLPLVERCKVLRAFIFLCVYIFIISSIHSIAIFFFAGRKYIHLVVISNIGWGRSFRGILTILQKLCLRKILV